MYREKAETIYTVCRLVTFRAQDFAPVSPSVPLPLQPDQTLYAHAHGGPTNSA